MSQVIEVYSFLHFPVVVITLLLENYSIPLLGQEDGALREQSGSKGTELGLPSTVLISFKALFSPSISTIRFYLTLSHHVNFNVKSNSSPLPETLAFVFPISDNGMISLPGNGAWECRVSLSYLSLDSEIQSAIIYLF